MSGHLRGHLREDAKPTGLIREEKAERNCEKFVILEKYPGITPEQAAEYYRERRGALADDLLDTKEPSPTTSDKD